MAVGTTEIKGGIISKAAGKIDYGIFKTVPGSGKLA